MDENEIFSYTSNVTTKEGIKDTVVEINSQVFTHRFCSRCPLASFESDVASETEKDAKVLYICILTLISRYKVWTLKLLT